MAGRQRKTPSAVGGHRGSSRLAGAVDILQANTSREYNVNTAYIEDSVHDGDGAADLQKQEAAQIEQPAQLQAQTLQDAPNGAPRRRTTIAEPGPRQGLQPGWTRATVIMRADALDTLKDYAYTHRTSLKEVLDAAVTQYIGTLDLTDLLHRP